MTVQQTERQGAFQRLQDALPGLTATEARIAGHLGLIWPELPFVSAAEVAQEVGVNPSSVTRLAQTLGFRGYPDLQRAARLELRARHAPAPHAAESQAAAHWERERATVDALSRLPETHLDHCAGLLAGAGRVWVTGARGSAPAAAYAAHLWGSVRPGVHHLPEGAPLEHWLDAGPGDLLVAFTVRRYARTTADLVQALTGRGAALLLVTDSPSAPGARQAAAVLALPSALSGSPLQPGASPGPELGAGGGGRFVPLVAPASVCALLAAKLAGRVGTQRLEAAENALNAQEAYVY